MASIQNNVCVLYYTELQNKAEAGELSAFLDNILLDILWIWDVRKRSVNQYI